jgi:ribosomal protein S17E
MKSINSKKARNEIAKLMNSIAHGWIMFGEARAKGNEEGEIRWHDSVKRATQELGDLYGIEMICYRPKV